MSAALNGQNVIAGSLHWPLNGAWSATLQLAADRAPAAGETATLQLDGGPAMLGRVVRSGVVAGRAHVRMTGGALEWTQPIDLRHYRNTTVDNVAADLGLELDTPSDVALPFWTRQATTIGEAVQALATHLQVSWRVNADGTLRLRAEDAAPEDVRGDARAVETLRDPARGIVEVAPEAAAITPGCALGNDLVGDVQYEFGDEAPLRCRYYTEQRAVLRGALERLIRWVTRDSLFLGQYTAIVQRQAADGTLDLLPDDPRLRGTGLQAVPIRHGLPGVEVEVPSGVRVLLGFDGGDPRQPYAALWHSEQVTAVRIGGSEAVALAPLVSARLDAIQAAFDAHIHTTTATVGAGATPGVIAPPTSPIGALDPVASEVLHAR